MTLVFTYEIILSIVVAFLLGVVVLFLYVILSKSTEGLVFLILVVILGLPILNVYYLDHSLEYSEWKDTRQEESSYIYPISDNGYYQVNEDIVYCQFKKDDSSGYVLRPTIDISNNRYKIEHIQDSSKPRFSKVTTYREREISIRKDLNGYQSLLLSTNPFIYEKTEIADEKCEYIFWVPIPKSHETEKL